MKHNYVTLQEAKAYLGVGSTRQDTLIEMLRNQSAARLNDILSVSDLQLHKVVDEVHDACNVKTFYLNDLHVKAVESVYDDGEAYTQDDPYDIDNYVLHLTDALTGGLRKAKITYAAGYNAYGSTTIEIKDYTGLSGKTITVGSLDDSDGDTLTEGVDFDAETSNEITAQNIAAAIDDIEGVEAFTVGAVVYVIEATEPGVEERSLASNALAADLEVADSTLTNLDYPDSLKAGQLLILSGLYVSRKNPNVKSYSIGGKSVTFGSEADAQSFKDFIKPYTRGRVFTV